MWNAISQWKSLLYSLSPSKPRYNIYTTGWKRWAVEGVEVHLVSGPARSTHRKGDSSRGSKTMIYDVNSPLFKQFLSEKVSSNAL
eukprot:s3217_g1.t1